MKPTLKQAFITALTAVTCLYLSQWVKLPQGFWAVMSSVVVMQSDAKATISASWMRIVGTLAGAVVGGGFLALWGYHVWSFGIAVGLVVVICALLRLLESYRIAAVTVAVVMLTGHTGSPWSTAFWRFVEVSFGILVALVISALFNPDYVYHRLRDIFKVAVIFLLISSTKALAVPDSFVPESGKTLLFVGQDLDTIAHYAAATGQAPSGTMLYTSIQEMTGLNAAVEYGAGPQYGDALLQYHHSVIQVGLYMVGALENTIAGRYDANLIVLANWIKKADRPIYLRIGYEFDTPSNHYDASEYVQAYQYVVDFLRKQGVQNAAFVWHTQCVEATRDEWMDWYPGDDYVDWFGVSIFSTYQISTATKFLGLARQHHKAFMIAESTPGGLYTTRAKLDWFKHIFHFIEEKNIEAFCYIDSNWDVMPMYRSQSWGDDRLEEVPALKDLWLNETSQDRYLKASTDLFQSLGWQ